MRGAVFSHRPNLDYLLLNSSRLFGLEMQNSALTVELLTHDPLISLKETFEMTCQLAINTRY